MSSLGSVLSEISMDSRPVRSLWGFALAVLLAGTLYAQGVGLSTIRGSVVDPTGGVVAGVPVTVTNVRTNVLVRSVTSNASGNYEVPDVLPGVYRVSAEIQGFKSFVADGITVEGAQIRRVDINLQLGEVSDKVTVEAGIAVIATDTSQVSTGFKSMVFDQTPMVKNYYPQSLMTSLAGVQSEAGGWNIRINGQPASQVALGMDGFTHDGTVNLINRMDYSEISVTGVNATADQARVANFNMVSKQGSNQYHGSFYYTLSNSALFARNYFDPQKIKENEHRSEVEMAGPIFRNRTFFYGSFFYQKVPQGSYYRPSVPTTKMRQGDFSQFAKGPTDPTNNQPFPNSQIPASRMDPLTLKVQDMYYPLPNLGGPDNKVANFGFLHPYPSDLIEALYPMVRIDHNITKNNSIYARFIQRYTPYVHNAGLPSLSWTRYLVNRGYVVTDTHVFSPAVVNTFRWGLKTDYQEYGSQVKGITVAPGSEIVQKLGLQGVNQGNFKEMGMPTWSITGLQTISIPGGGVVNDTKQNAWADSLTWAAGRHVMKFGGEVKRITQYGGQVPSPNWGAFSFIGNFTGQPHADFLLGIPYSSARLTPRVGRTPTQEEFGFFAMDTFKVTNKLNVDYGLRWDYFTAPYYQDGLQFRWDKDTDTIIIPDGATGQVSPLYSKSIKVATGQVKPNASRRNFRPRIGAAYRVKPNTVIRGGYGVFTEQIGYFSQLQGGGPFQIAETYFNELQGGKPMFSFPNPFPASLASAAIPSQSVSGFPKQTRNGVIHQFNFTVERQIGQVGIRLSYIGSRSRGLNYYMAINKPAASLIPFTAARRPYPEFVGVSYQFNNGANNYNSIQVEAQRKVSWLTFDVHYTLQSSLSNYLNLEDPYHSLMWNRDTFNARHKGVVSTVIDLPWGRGRRFLSNAPALVNGIIGDWKILTISLFQSGQFFSPSFSGADPSNTNSFGGLADRVCNGNLPSSQRTVQRWFDPSCFAVPPAGRYGNSGVNILERPAINVDNMSMVKNFHLSDRFNLEYVAAFSNLFNKPMFAPPLTNISAPNTGQITDIMRGADQSMEETRARRIEMTLRLRW